MNTYILYRWIKKVWLSLCLAGFILIFVYSIKIQYFTDAEITNISVKSEDGAIDIKWNSPNLFICDTIRVVISDGENVVYEQDILSTPYEQHLSYKNGEHGKLYTVSITAKYKDGTLGETHEKQALFLNYDELPAGCARSNPLDHKRII